MECRLQKLVELFASQFTIAKNFGQKSGADCFTRVDGHDSCSAIGVPKKMVTPLHAHDVKSSFSQSANQLFARDAG
jgi:hypothetical protein